MEKEFSYYGKLQSAQGFDIFWVIFCEKFFTKQVIIPLTVWIARRPPGFAYVEYEDARDARDAVKDLDGR